VAAAGLVALLSAACAAEVTPSRAHARGQQPIRRDCTRAEAYGADAELARLADEVPGFGGAFADGGEGGGAGTAVYLTDVSRAPQAVALLAERLQLEASRVRVVEGRYTTRQLAEWRCRAEDVLAGERWTFSGIDGARNRVAVRLADEDARRRAAAALAREGLPAEAFVLELGGLAQLD
jgi:hypothetical protein